MSYDPNSFDNSNQNDPNTFSSGGRRGGAGVGAGDNWDVNSLENSQSQGGNRRQQGGLSSDLDQQGGMQQSQGGYGGQQGYGGQSGYQGDTTDTNTPGAAGDFGGQQFGNDNYNTGSQQQDWDTQGTQAGRTGGSGGFNDEYDNTDSSGYGSGGQTGQTGQRGKASMGDKLKGNMEKIAGKVSRNEGMAQRGQDRTEGDFNSSNY